MSQTEIWPYSRSHGVRKGPIMLLYEAFTWYLSKCAFNKYSRNKTYLWQFSHCQSKYWHKPRLYLIRFCVPHASNCMQVHRSDYIMCTWLTHSHKTGSRCSAWLLYSKEFRATTLPVSSDNNQYHVYWPSSMKNTSLLRVFWYLIFLKKKCLLKKYLLKKPNY